MTTHEHASSEKAEPARGQSPAPAAEPALQANGATVQLRAAPGARLLRSGDVLALQRTIGNRATAGLLSIQREETGAAAAAAGNKVVMSLKTPEAIVDASRTAAEIGAGHGQTTAAGWCSSNPLTINVLKVWKPEESSAGEQPTIEVSMELTWAIEVPTDRAFRPGTANYAILLSHEQGHRTLEIKLAQTLLVQGLRPKLASLAEPDEAKVRALIVEAEKEFSAQRKTETDAYHAASYPRMALAYARAKMSLPDLMADSPHIAQLVRGLRALNAALAGVPAPGSEPPAALNIDDAGAAQNGQAILDAVSGLSEEDMIVAKHQPEIASLAHTANEGCERYLELMNGGGQSAQPGAFGDIASELVQVLYRM